MPTIFKPAVPIVLGALGALALAVPATAQFRGPPAKNFPDMVNHKPILYADLGLGGPGQFTGVVDEAKGQVCYIINTPSLEGPTGAMIADKSGKAVVKLAVPTGGASGGCADVGMDLAKTLVAKANDYTVQVNSTAYPDGATSGMLKSFHPPSYTDAAKS